MSAPLREKVWDTNTEAPAHTRATLKLIAKCLILCKPDGGSAEFVHKLLSRMTTERESDANSGVDYEAFLEAQWKDIKEFMNQSAENYETDTKKEQSYIPMLEQWTQELVRYRVDEKEILKWSTEYFSAVYVGEVEDYLNKKAREMETKMNYIASKQP